MDRTGGVQFYERGCSEFAAAVADVRAERPLQLRSLQLYKRAAGLRGGGMRHEHHMRQHPSVGARRKRRVRLRHQHLRWCDMRSRLPGLPQRERMHSVLPQYSDDTLRLLLRATLLTVS